MTRPIDESIRKAQASVAPPTPAVPAMAAEPTTPPVPATDPPSQPSASAPDADATTARPVTPTVAARRRRRRAQPRPSALVFDTVQEAAAKLGLDEEALRSRCRRAARKVDGQEVAQLGGGITAFKLGTTWRIRFP